MSTTPSAEASIVTILPDVELTPTWPTVPRIYLRGVAQPPLKWGYRLLSIGIALAALTPLILATLIPPSPSGHGTHTALGLRDCEFMRTSGLPCPSCGMTTSFAWLVRGNLLASFWVQPAGMLIGIAAGITFWAGMYIGVTGKPVHRLLRQVPGTYWVVPSMVIVIIAWAWKIFAHLKGIDGWG